MSTVIKNLNQYYGVNHVVSLVDRHESNGVEGTNKQILRHLRALVQEERICDQWSSPTVLPVIFYLINSHDSSETGFAPFEAHFGTDDLTYFKMPENSLDNNPTHEFVKLLNQNLKFLTEKSLEFQRKLITERTSKNVPELQNVYQPGDFVLFAPSSQLPKSKLTPHYLGPYVVIGQTKNDVTARHLSSGIVSVLHVERLKRFYGDMDQAKSANVDYDQHEVDTILGYTGDPTNRSSMEFEILFRAGDSLWKKYCRDIYDTTYFEDFCRSHPELSPLLTTKAIHLKDMARINKSPIVEVKPNDIAYMNLRFYGYEKYKSFHLPNHERITYVIKIIYGELSTNQCDISVRIPLLKKCFIAKHQFVLMFGCYKSVESNIVLVDETFLLKNTAATIKN
jgi:hypothetical protein